MLDCAGSAIGLSSIYKPALTFMTVPSSAAATAPLIVAFASPSFLPVLLSSPSLVTYKTFVTVAPAPNLTISVENPTLSLRAYNSASDVLRAISPNCSSTVGFLPGIVDRLMRIIGLAISDAST